MKDSQKKKSITIPAMFCVVFIILVFVSISLVREIARNRIIDTEIKKIEDEAERLEVKNLEILELVKELEDTDFLEKEARLKLGLQKPGENVVVINRIGQEKQIFGESDSLNNKINPVRWRYYFFRR
ncbi:MAG: septum formation initiator family protein [Patescibacteria group bacterium]|nr:septum formation initiator family protein [Patescibacteria group bacterium]